MNARDLIMQADEIAMKQGLNQSKWSASAGYASNGQTVSRIIATGECKLSTFIALLDAISCELRIVRK